MACGTIKKLIVVVGTLLLVQYLTGIGINLFVAIPQQTAFNFFGYSGGIEVLAHITISFLIIVAALVILISSIKLDNAILSMLSLLAFVFTVGSVGDGFLFMLGQQSTYSLIMAIGFVSAYTLYFLEVMEIGRLQVSENSKSKRP